MIYTALTKKALEICFNAHKEQKDKSGLPYVFHPFHLAESMDDELSTVCALLHDVIEDTDISFGDLRKRGFPEEVITVLSFLTHEPSVPYEKYIENIAKNKTAVKIKIADLRHNSDLSRLNEITENDIERKEKYQRAIEYLENHR